MELQLLYDRLQLSQLDRQTIKDLWEINNLDSNKKEFCCVLAVLFEQFSNGSLCLPFGVDNQIRLPQEWHETFAKGEELFVSGYFSGVTAVADGKDTAFLPLVLRTLNNGDKLLYFYRCWKSEDMLRQNLKRRLEFVDDNCMQEPCSPEENGLEVMQKEAVRQVVQKNFLIVTGGPGTGKTYTAARMIKKTLRVHPEWKVALAAPTGKAAKRLEESLAKENLIDMCGQTLHRLLGITRDSVTAKYNHDNPLPYDLILVDYSMCYMDGTDAVKVIRFMRDNAIGERCNFNYDVLKRITFATGAMDVVKDVLNDKDGEFKYYNKPINKRYFIIYS